MDKEECKARLHLLGFDTANKAPSGIIIKYKDKPKHIFIFAAKQQFVGYIALSNGYSMPNYFCEYEHMIDKAIGLKANDQN